MAASRLQLTRPLAFFDCETTGRFPDRDRIVEIAYVVALPDGSRGQLQTYVNPGLPIPAEATAIHGITDAMVADAPTFKAIAPLLATSFGACDLAGFNIRRFDVPLLVAEFARAGVPFSLDGRRLVDLYALYVSRERRDLAAAVQFYCGRAHEGAHGALADAEASLNVLAGMFERYADLPTDVDALHAAGKDPSWIDDNGRLVWIGGVACVGFGKHAGRPLESVCAEPDGRDWCRWLLSKDFPADTKAIVYAALNGKLPTPPAREAVPV